MLLWILLGFVEVRGALLRFRKVEGVFLIFECLDVGCVYTGFLRLEGLYEDLLNIGLYEELLKIGGVYAKFVKAGGSNVVGAKVLVKVGSTFMKGFLGRIEGL